MTIPAVALSSIQHYIAKGISKDVAVGIVACLYYESKLNPGSQGVQHTETPGALNPSGAYGIASWNGPRQQALANFAKVKGLDPSQLTTQLDFVLTECANSYPGVWAAIRSGTSYRDFIPIFVNQYEIPADKTKEINAALTYADAWYPLVTTSTAPTPVPTPAPIPVTPAPIPSGAIRMDPAVLVQLAPLIEALAAGLLRGLLTQLVVAPGAAPVGTPVAAPAAPAIDLGSLVNTLAPLLTQQLAGALPNLIAVELAKFSPGAKT